MLKTTIYLILLLALLFLGYLASVIAIAHFNDYKPLESIKLYPKGTSAKPVTDTMSLLIWNIGFAGLGADADFFYDGGAMVRSPKTSVENNFNFIKQTLSSYYKYDFVLLQEVDLNSKRSYHTNQQQEIADLLPYYNAASAPNYQVGFVPMPITNPLGKVNSGLLSLSKQKAIESIRYQFPGNFIWPKSLFFLDRCFLLERFAAPNGKQLVVINTHNSAYDNGSLKQQQMDYMKAIIVEEYEKGNYVIVGGDWNQTPPNFNNKTFEQLDGETAYTQIPIPNDYVPSDWTWAYDAKTPTNRKVAQPYNPRSTFTTIIDYYLVSPNIEVLSTKGTDFNFIASDHQPVAMKIALK